MTVTSVTSDLGNPLLQRLQERNVSEWNNDLWYDPRDLWLEPLGSVPESRIEELEHLVVPTQTGVSVALNLTSRLISSLRRRDPRLSENRKRLYKLAELSAKDLGKDLQKMPWFSDGAGGAILRGPTGCSKSHSLGGFMRLTPNTLEHGPNEECGWSHLQQLVYLRVFMPADYSRSGLLHGIVAEMDSVLGTNYMLEIERKKTIEKQLIYVLQLLTVHRCGTLILEEAQDRNLKQLVWGTEFVTVFLRIMNSGVPLVLVGNPLAFEHVLKFSQDMRRLTKGGVFDFAPVYDHDEVEWTTELVPGIWNWTIFNKPDSYAAPAKLLFERTGGIHGVLAIYRKECLVTALRAQADRVEEIHVHAAWYSPVMKPMHELIGAYADKTKGLPILATMPDQPIAYLSKRWSEITEMRAVMAEVTKRQASK